MGRCPPTNSTYSSTEANCPRGETPGDAILLLLLCVAVGLPLGPALLSPSSALHAPSSSRLLLLLLLKALACTHARTTRGVHALAAASSSSSSSSVPPRMLQE